MHSTEPLLPLLEALIDMDIEYERQREKLSRSSDDMVSRSRLLRKLKERHSERRRPVIQQLMVLQAVDANRNASQFNSPVHLNVS
jgi:hypothetical protein